MRSNSILILKFKRAALERGSTQRLSVIELTSPNSEFTPSQSSLGMSQSVQLRLLDCTTAAVY